jgi:hypothetical protein
MTHRTPDDREDDERQIRHFPEGAMDQADPERSLQQASPSLRNMAASAYTFEGQQERGFNDAELASRGDWRGPVIRIFSIAALVFFLMFLVLGSVFGH